VINVDRGYVHTREEFEFIDGIFDLCRSAKACGYLIIVLTNQAGIARGYYTEQVFEELTGWMCNKFLELNVALDHVYYCPYHPVHGIGKYKLDSFMRKPGPGMILQAALAYDLDLDYSVLIGDNYTDIQAGLVAGVGTNILLEQQGGKEKASTGYFSIGTLAEAIPFLGGPYLRD